MKNLLNLEGVEVLTREQKSKTNGGGPDLCYSYWTFGQGTVYCCGGGSTAQCTDGEYV